MDGADAVRIGQECACLLNVEASPASKQEAYRVLCSLSVSEVRAWNTVAQCVHLHLSEHGDSRVIIAALYALLALPEAKLLEVITKPGVDQHWRACFGSAIVAVRLAAVRSLSRALLRAWAVLQGVGLGYQSFESSQEREAAGQSAEDRILDGWRCIASCYDDDNDSVAAAAFSALASLLEPASRHSVWLEVLGRLKVPTGVEPGCSRRHGDAQQLLDGTCRYLLPLFRRLAARAVYMQPTSPALGAGVVAVAPVGSSVGSTGHIAIHSTASNEDDAIEDETSERHVFSNRRSSAGSGAASAAGSEVAAIAALRTVTRVVLYSIRCGKRVREGGSVEARCPAATRDVMVVDTQPGQPGTSSAEVFPEDLVLTWIQDGISPLLRPGAAAPNVSIAAAETLVLLSRACCRYQFAHHQMLGLMVSSAIDAALAVLNTLDAIADSGQLHPYGRYTSNSSNVPRPIALRGRCVAVLCAAVTQRSTNGVGSLPLPRRVYALGRGLIECSVGELAWDSGRDDASATLGIEGTRITPDARIGVMCAIWHEVLHIAICARSNSTPECPQRSCILTQLLGARKAGRRSSTPSQANDIHDEERGMLHEIIHGDVWNNTINVRETPKESLVFGILIALLSSEPSKASVQQQSGAPPRDRLSSTDFPRTWDISEQHSHLKCTHFALLTMYDFAETEDRLDSLKQDRASCLAKERRWYGGGFASCTVSHSTVVGAAMEQKRNTIPDSLLADSAMSTQKLMHWVEIGIEVLERTVDCISWATNESRRASAANVGSAGHAYVDVLFQICIVSLSSPPTNGEEGWVQIQARLHKLLGTLIARYLGGSELRSHEQKRKCGEIDGSNVPSRCSQNTRSVFSRLLWVLSHCWLLRFDGPNRLCTIQEEGSSLLAALRVEILFGATKQSYGAQMDALLSLTHIALRVPGLCEKARAILVEAAKHGSCFTLPLRDQARIAFSAIASGAMPQSTAKTTSPTKNNPFEALVNPTAHTPTKLSYETMSFQTFAQATFAAPLQPPARVVLGGDGGLLYKCAVWSGAIASTAHATCDPSTLWSLCAPLVAVGRRPERGGSSLDARNLLLEGELRGGVLDSAERHCGSDDVVEDCGPLELLGSSDPVSVVGTLLTLPDEHQHVLHLHLRNKTNAHIEDVRLSVEALGPMHVCSDCVHHYSLISAKGGVVECEVRLKLVRGAGLEFVRKGIQVKVCWNGEISGTDVAIQSDPWWFPWTLQLLPAPLPAPSPGCSQQNTLRSAVLWRAPRGLGGWVSLDGFVETWQRLKYTYDIEACITCPDLVRAIGSGCRRLSRVAHVPSSSFSNGAHVAYIGRSWNNHVVAFVLCATVKNSEPQTWTSRLAIRTDESALIAVRRDVEHFFGDTIGSNYCSGSSIRPSQRTHSEIYRHARSLSPSLTFHSRSVNPEALAVLRRAALSRYHAIRRSRS